MIAVVRGWAGVGGGSQGGGASVDFSTANKDTVTFRILSIALVLAVTLHTPCVYCTTLCAASRGARPLS
eukprot:10786826-Alexandrium_andersonii.AAC.1